MSPGGGASALTLAEAKEVLSEIAALSDSLSRLVHDSVQAVLLRRGGAGTADAMTVAAAREIAAKEKPWADMTAEEHTAAELIGYDEASWDAGDVPETCWCVSGASPMTLPAR